MFTKKNYDKIADLLNKGHKKFETAPERIIFRCIVYDFTTMLEKDNPKFNGHMFLKRCFDE